MHEPFKKLKHRAFFALFLSFAIPTPFYSSLAADTPAEKARYANTYGANNGPFSLYNTANVNAAPDRLNDEKRSAMGTARLAEYYNVTNFEFICPGNSFISAVRSTYTDEARKGSSNPRNRSFDFTCAFLENSKGELLKKSGCEPGDNDALDNVEGKLEARSNCNATGFIAGMRSKKFYNGNLQDDRRFKSNCCQLKSYAGTTHFKPAAAASCKTFSYTAGSSFEMTCPADMILRDFTSVYHATLDDRAFNFTCCPAEVTPAP